MCNHVEGYPIDAAEYKLKRNMEMSKRHERSEADMTKTDRCECLMKPDETTADIGMKPKVMVH